MYRILKSFVKKPEHLRVLRQVFGVPAEHPASEDFRNSLLKGEVPKNIAEMEDWSIPIWDLLLMKDTRVAGAKILAKYLFEGWYPYRLVGLFTRRTSESPYRDPAHGIHVTKENLARWKPDDVWVEGDATEKIPMKRDTVDGALRRMGSPFSLPAENSSCEQAPPPEPDDFDKSG